MIKVKIKAAIAHGMLTVLVGMMLSVLVFGLWYPKEFAQIMPGTKLFILILLVEVVLGPSMSLIIYNPNKPSRELMIDYGVIIAIQLSALIYGVLSVTGSRPAYIVFVKDRFEVVAAIEVDLSDMRQTTQFRALPWNGPELVCVRPVIDSVERERLLFEEYAQGRDVQHLPRFYRKCDDSETYDHAFNLERLLPVITMKKGEPLFDSVLDNKELRWLPVHGKQGVWVALIKKGQNTPVSYIKFDPY